ncbi:hypothetical protein LPJ56_003562, partial [Coemansia sp. RSA 2599]
MSLGKRADWQDDSGNADSSKQTASSLAANNSGSATASAAGSAGAAGKQASQKRVEKIVLQYLKSKGYKDAEKALRENANLEGLETTLADLANAFPGNEVGSDAS